jgi:hypothetical protein
VQDVEQPLDRLRVVPGQVAVRRPVGQGVRQLPRVVQPGQQRREHRAGQPGRHPGAVPLPGLPGERERLGVRLLRRRAALSHRSPNGGYSGWSPFPCRRRVDRVELGGPGLEHPGVLGVGERLDDEVRGVDRLAAGADRVDLGRQPPGDVRPPPQPHPERDHDQQQDGRGHRVPAGDRGGARRRRRGGRARRHVPPMHRS